MIMVLPVLLFMGRSSSKPLHLTILLLGAVSGSSQDSSTTLPSSQTTSSTSTSWPMAFSSVKKEVPICLCMRIALRETSGAGMSLLSPAAHPLGLLRSRLRLYAPHRRSRLAQTSKLHAGESSVCHAQGTFAQSHTSRPNSPALAPSSQPCHSSMASSTSDLTLQTSHCRPAPFVSRWQTRCLPPPSSPSPPLKLSYL